jgi:hypothetical protein
MGGLLAAGWQTVTEKTVIQKYLDAHWYGEPKTTITTDTGIYALVDNDADSKIYEPDIKLAKTVDGTVVYYDMTSGLQGGAREKRFAIKYTPATSFRGSLDMTVSTASTKDWLVECVSFTETNQTWAVKCSSTSDTYLITTNEYTSTSFSVDDLTFKFKATATPKPCFVGDSFIIRAGSKKPEKVNVQGTFTITTAISTDLSSDSFTFTDIDKNPIADDNSWVIVVEHVDDYDGNTLYWQVTNREAKMICESSTTKFWFDDSSTIVDSVTQTVLRDSMSVLKSNLTADRLAALKTNREFYIQGIEKDSIGNSIVTKVSVLPTHTNQDYFTTENVNNFSSLIDLTKDYVYFKLVDGELVGIDGDTNIAYVASKFTDAEQMTYVPTDAEADQVTYVRKIGRNALDFLWSHYAPNDSIVDSSTTNINDIYVLTKGYYNSTVSYIRGITDIEPIEPTSLELKNSYSSLLSSKMMSDTVVLHSAKIKLLFGDKSDKQLRSKFKVIRNPRGSLSNETVKQEILGLINSYFAIEEWNFGDTFYAQDLLSIIQTSLATEINSIVLVPSYANNYFGNMLIVESGSHEILQSCALIDDIEIVSSYNDSNLRIK